SSESSSDSTSESDSYSGMSSKGTAVRRPVSRRVDARSVEFAAYAGAATPAAIRDPARTAAAFRDFIVFLSSATRGAGGEFCRRAQRSPARAETGKSKI